MAAIRDKSKKFHKFLQGLKAKYAQALPNDNEPMLDRFVFYLLFYSNPIGFARKAQKSLTDDGHFASWSEVRVATVREITAILDESKIKPAEFLAPRLVEFLQRIFEEVDDTRLEAYLERIEEGENPKEKKKITEEVREAVTNLPGIPPWGSTYLLALLGLDDCLPLDPHTEAALTEQKVFGPTVKTVPQKKRVLKALLDGIDDISPIAVHHLLVEYAKRDLKRKG
ncbi:MAG: hypothetical protein AB7N76_27345 [Planctomycetota bacterium]